MPNYVEFLHNEDFTTSQSQLESSWDPENLGSAKVDFKPSNNPLTFGLKKAQRRSIVLWSFIFLIIILMSLLITVICGKIQMGILETNLQNYTDDQLNHFEGKTKTFASGSKRAYTRLRDNNEATFKRINKSVHDVIEREEATNQKIGDFSEAIRDLNETVNKNMTEIRKAVATNKNHFSNSMANFTESLNAVVKNGNHSREMMTNKMANVVTRFNQVKETFTRLKASSDSSQNEFKTKLQNLSQSNEEALSKANNQISSLTQRQSKLERTLSIVQSIYNSTVKNWTELLSQKGDVDVELAKMKNEFKEISKKVNRYEKLFEILKMDWLGDHQFQPIGTFGSFLLLPGGKFDFRTGGLRCHILESHIVELNGNSTLYQKKLNAIRSKYPNKEFYVGMTDKEEEGTWKWIKAGEVFPSPTGNFNPWIRGEPNNNGKSEHCAEIWQDGLLNDIDCNSKKPVICEKKPDGEPASKNGASESQSGSINHDGWNEYTEDYYDDEDYADDGLFG